MLDQRMTVPEADLLTADNIRRVKAYEQAEKDHWNALLNYMTASTLSKDDRTHENVRAADEAWKKLREADDTLGVARQAIIDSVTPDKKQAAQKADSRETLFPATGAVLPGNQFCK